MAHFWAVRGVKKSKISKLLEKGGELGESKRDVIPAYGDPLSRGMRGFGQLDAQPEIWAISGQNGHF